VAINEFDNFNTLHSKISFINLLQKLELPHPPSDIYTTGTDLENFRPFPYYIKLEYGSSSSGVWRISNLEDLKSVTKTLKEKYILNGNNRILIQDDAPGTLEMAHSIFKKGHLQAIHCCRRQMEGARGSSCSKIGVHRPVVQRHIEKLGKYLNWHGSLTIDYIYDSDSGIPLYIDANPRLVEPMNSTLSGLNLAEQIVQMEKETQYEKTISPKEGAKTHMLMMALMGVAQKKGSRFDLICEIGKALLKKEIYSESIEELTPFRKDPLSIIPLIAVTTRLLINPKSYDQITSKSISNFSVPEDSVQKIDNIDFTSGLGGK
jgi:predicted ATP-grasp superfamily ATP-dependent carboligase